MVHHKIPRYLEELALPNVEEIHICLTIIYQTPRHLKDFAQRLIAQHTLKEICPMIGCCRGQIGLHHGLRFFVAFEWVRARYPPT